jgi:hypothetical protein
LQDPIWGVGLAVLVVGLGLILVRFGGVGGGATAVVELGRYQLAAGASGGRIGVTVTDGGIVTPLVTFAVDSPLVVRQLVCVPFTQENVVLLGQAQGGAVSVEGLGAGTLRQSGDGVFVFVTAGMPVPGTEWSVSSASLPRVTGHVAGYGTRLTSPGTSPGKGCIAYDSAIEAEKP